MVEFTMIAGWLAVLLQSEFFGLCTEHPDVRKNEKNVFCIDCSLSFCRHCALAGHRSHRRLQICRYVYQDVVRLSDIEQHLDCLGIQTYKINGEKAVHLNSRPQQLNARPSTKLKYGTTCEVCGRYIQDLPNRFCSIGCKVAFLPVKVRTHGSGKVHRNPSLCWKEGSYQEGSVEERRSCVSSADVSDECEAPWRSPWKLRKRQRLSRRKGIPVRSPLY